MALETFRKEVDESRRFQFDFSLTEEIVAGDTISSVAVSRTPDTTKSEAGSVHTYDALEDLFEDVTIDANSSLLTDVPLPGLVGDMWLQGHRSVKFGGIRWILSVAGVGGVATWEYSKGASEWDALSVTPAEGNANFTALINRLTFTPPSDWALDTVNGVTAYWVRGRVTTQYTTAPSGSVVRLTAMPDLTLGATAILGGVVQALISGGLSGTRYSVKCKATLTSGAILVRRGGLEIIGA